MIIREIRLCSAWVCLIVSFLTSGIAQGVLNKSKLFSLLISLKNCLLVFRRLLSDYRLAAIEALFVGNG